MNPLFTDTMTVYNYHRDPETGEEAWYRSVIKGVQWRHNKTEITLSDGVRTESKVEHVTIDCGRSYGNKPYLPPQEFRKLPTGECGKYWTLDPRTSQDMIVLGAVDQEISADYRLSRLLEDHQYAVTVTSASDNRGRPRLRHIQATGK